MICIGVVAHTTRSAEAKALAKHVGASFISIDTGLLGCEANHEAVQHHLANIPSSWSVILEDDALVEDGFRDQVIAALPHSPSPIVSLYLGRQRPPHWQRRIKHALHRANTEQASWIISTHLLHAVGYCIKTELLPSLLAHDSALPADEHIGDWARRYGHTIAYTVGSLVDHADMPTIVEHPDGKDRLPGRKAWQVGGRTTWTSISVPL